MILAEEGEKTNPIFGSIWAEDLRIISGKYTRATFRHNKSKRTRNPRYNYLTMLCKLNQTIWSTHVDFFSSSFLGIYFTFILYSYDHLSLIVHSFPLKNLQEIFSLSKQI